MKHFLTTLFCLSAVLISQAQNYDCIKPLSVHHYVADTAKPVFSIRIDSVIQHIDTFYYYNYLMAREINGTWLWTTKGASWTGKYIIEYPGSKWVFFNGLNDSIMIYSNAQLNDPWRFCTLSTGEYYMATITNISEQTFIGLTDSVKTLQIQKYDSSGQTISSPYNGFQIKISKNYGMVSIFNFYSFENENSPGYDDAYDFINTFHAFNLIGTTQPQAGWNEINAYNVFGNNYPGDEIHVNESSYVLNVPDYYTTAGGQIYQFLNRTDYANPDSVSYQIFRCEYQINRTNNVITDSYYNDYTYFQGYNLSNSFLNLLTLELHCSGGPMFYNKYLNRITNSSIMLASCDSITDFIMYEGVSTITYQPGLWGLKIDGWGMSPYDYFSSQIIYYSLSGNTWGTPTSCLIFMILGKDDVALNERTQIYPSPSVRTVYVNTEVQNTELSISLFDVAGREVLKKQISFGQNPIDISMLSEGIYLYRISDLSLTYSQGKIIKVKE